MNQKVVKTSRFAAIETLIRLQRTKFPVKPLFDTVAEECGISGAERGLAMNIVYGVLRQRDYLDLLIKTLCNRPVKKLDQFVYGALSIGLFQLFCLDRVPDSAAVNETVNALKSARLKKHLHGFVNGVLRGAIRQREQLPAPGAPLPSGRPLLNHPIWMTDRWARRFGREEMERICRINSLESQLVLRVNSSQINRDELLERFRKKNITSTPGKYSPYSIVLPDFNGSIITLPGYEEGLFQVQDEAAQLASMLLGPFKDKGNYLDACAGLGGKTSHIIELVAKRDARVVAVEPEPKRQRLLKENIDRLFPGKHLTVSPSNLQDYCRTSRLQFDGVIVDAPCSGTGVTGRHPDIRWNRSLDDIERYQLEQINILEHAAELVSPQGILVYATCSLEIEENQHVIEVFLNRRDDFVITDCSKQLPDNAHDFVKDRFFNPHPTEAIDGFFAARLQRKS